MLPNTRFCMFLTIASERFVWIDCLHWVFLPTQSNTEARKLLCKELAEVGLSIEEYEAIVSQFEVILTDDKKQAARETAYRLPQAIRNLLVQ